MRYIRCLILDSQLVGEDSWCCGHIDYLVAECGRYFFESLLFGLTMVVSLMQPFEDEVLVRVEEINYEEVDRAASNEHVVIVLVNIRECRRSSFGDCGPLCQRYELCRGCEIAYFPH
jgi:hypothetical protein